MRLLKLLSENWGRESTWVEGRTIRLQVEDARPPNSRGVVDLESAIRNTINLFEEKPGNAAERLVAEELLVVGAVPDVPLWRSALCGIGRGYLSPFNVPILSTPLFLALELYAAAGVSRTCREHGIHTMDDVAHLQAIASTYEEHFMGAITNLPDEMAAFVRQLRSTVPTYQERKDMSDTAAGLVMRLLRRWP